MRHRLGTDAVEAIHFERCVCGGPRVHVRKAGAERAICGLEVRGVQPTNGAKCSCYNCMKRIRDSERPPMPSEEFAQVTAAKSTEIHLARRSYPPLFVLDKTLCGLPVAFLSALGSAGISCPKCAALAAVKG